MDTAITKVKSISQLHPANSLEPSSLLLVSQLVASQQETGFNKYQNVCLSVETLQESMNNGVITHLKTWHKLKEGPNQSSDENTNFAQMEEQLSALIEGREKTTLKNLVLNGEHVFAKHPEILDTLPLSFDDSLSAKAINLADLKNFDATNNFMMLNGNSNFTTYYNNVEDNEYPSPTITGIQNAPEVEAEKHNVYIFKINGYESNEWTCPASGIFTCYGWVDEKNPTLSSNCTRWIALKGLFTDPDTNDQFWKIIQLQPVIPNEFCSYVSFTFPVQAGFKLKLECGFNVGTNSDKYNNINGSLTNHLANAFVGGIYSKMDYGWNGQDTREFSCSTREPKLDIGSMDKKALFNLLSDEILDLISSKNPDMVASLKETKTVSEKKTTKKKSSKKI